MKIYFAGNITEEDWRFSFMKPEHFRITKEYVEIEDKKEGNYEWPVMRRAVFNALDYVGPFLDDGSVSAHGFFCSIGDIDAPVPLFPGVDAADIVFAYLKEDSSLDGTALEVGYAIGAKKQVIVAFTDWWKRYNFPGLLMSSALAEHDLYCDDPAASLRKMLLSSGLLFNSPIEKLFWREAQVAIPDLIPQLSIGPYFADFALPEMKLALELDGHDFHSSKEQRTRDAKRDRYFMEQGWQVMRFTGSEIYKDVRRCVDQVVRIIASMKK